MFEDRVLVPPHRVTQVVRPHQGHRVPDHGYYPSFGFESDTPTMVDSVPEVEEFPPGATAQNGMQEVRYFQCRACEAVVRENEIPDHPCASEDG